jgi:hypothetical protein
MGTEEGEKVQVKGIYNIHNNIIAKNFPNLEKVAHSEKEASRTPNTLIQNRTCLQHIIIKTTSTENIKRILKAVREKNK